MAQIEEVDSGMESLTASSKDLTPEKMRGGSDDEDDLSDEELDETLAERLMGLGEMFPDSVRNATYSLVTGTYQGIKGLYSFSRVATWLFFSSSVILFAPVLFEVERAQMQEMQRSQQKQVLLGPNSAVSGSMGLLPPVPR